MRKSELLNKLKQIVVQSEEEEIDDLRPIEVLDIVLNYINDDDIRETIDEILM